MISDLVRLDIVILSMDGLKKKFPAMMVTTVQTIIAILLVKMFANIHLLNAMITILVPLILVLKVMDALIMNKSSAKELMPVLQ
jgi:hypothetical protein